MIDNPIVLTSPEMVALCESAEFVQDSRFAVINGRVIELTTAFDDGDVIDIITVCDASDLGMSNPINLSEMQDLSYEEMPLLHWDHYRNKRDEAKQKFMSYVMQFMG